MKHYFKIKDKADRCSGVKTYVIKSKDGSISYVKARSKDSAVKFIKDARTALGEEIITSRTNDAGQTSAVLKRAHDYVVVRGYNKDCGTYEHGYFGFADEAAARDFYNKVK